MFNSGYKGIRAVDGSGIVTLKDVEVQQTSLQPQITSWAYTNGAYVPYPDTAIVGGETIVIYGSGFQNGANVYIGSTSVTSTRLDQNRITFTAPSQSAGSYVLYVVNPNGNAAVYAPGIYYNSYPVWNTTTYANTFITPTSSVSFNLNATDSANLTFTLQSGSLPTGLTLYPSGLISGTTTVANTTVYTFTAVATDSFNQAAQASIIYTITYTVSDPYFNQTTLLLNGETNTNTYIRDSSNNNFALTPYGSALSNRFSPIWPTGYYSVSFDGTASGLNAVGTTPFQLGTSDFTVEAWIYITSNSADNYIGGTYDGTNGGWAFYIPSGGTTFSFRNGDSNIATSSSTSISLNRWYHVAAVRASGSISFYINGAIIGSAISYGYNITRNNTYGCSIGRYLLSTSSTGGFFSGYISNFRTVNGTALYTGSSYTVPTSPLTPVSNTVLLACQSSQIIDNGPYAYTITQTGLARVVANQPFANVPTTSTANTNNTGYYSSWFDGSTAYLTAGGYNIQSSTNPVTIECWFYLTGSYSGNPVMFDGFYKTSPYTAGSWRLYINSSGYVDFLVAPGGGTTSYDTTSASAVTLNSWNHAAIVRNGTTITVYLNGVAGTPFTYSGVIGTGYSLALGAATLPGGGGGVGQYFPGFISNARIINGTALYTSNFTPSTTPLTAVANTVLLTCQNSMIVDNSTNAFTLTPTGKVIVSQNQPFASPTVTSINTTPANYGCVLMDGSTGYISSNVTPLGAGNWTVEFWMYATTTSNQYIFTLGATPDWSDGYGTYLIYYNTASVPYFAWSVASNGNNFIAPPITNQWVHIAIVQIGTTAKIYLNGVAQSTTLTNTTNLTGSKLQIGHGGAGSWSTFNGSIANFRVVSGTAVYTNNFIPPNQPLTPVANTSLLTLQNKNSSNNNVFYDEGQYNYSVGIIAGNPSQGTFTPFSQTGWSNYFAGSGYMSTTNSSQFIASGNGFTVEAWVFYTAISNYTFIVASTTGNNNYNPYWFIGSTNTGTWRLSWGDATSVDTGVSIVLNAWNHVAMVMSSSGSGVFYVNGVSKATASGKTLNGSSTGVLIADGGGTIAGTYPLSGYVSNIRYVSNSSVYTGNFTPSTTPLTAVANTQLLTCQSNRFIDNSTNNFALTLSGAPQVQAFSPFAPGVTYSTANNGGSIYFNGSSKIGLPVSRNWYFGQYSGTFTIECWLYQTASPGSGNSCRLLQTGPNGVGTSLVLLSISPTNTVAIGIPYSGTGCTTTGTFSNNCWNHIAICSNAWTVSIYINGVLSGGPTAITAQGLYAGNNDFQIGYDTPGTVNAAYTGYMSGLRITSNQVVYSGAFTPPTAPPNPTANTLVLLSGTNSGIQDATGKNDIVTVGSAKTQANTVKFGSGAMYFDGGAFLGLPSGSPSLLQWYSGSCTIEYWINPQTFTQGGQSDPVIVGNMQYNSTGNYWSFGPISSGVVKFYYYNGSQQYIVTTATISTNTWTHLAFVNNAGSLTIYINGVSSATGTISGTPQSGVQSGYGIVVGGTNNSYFTGYIDELRISKVARYTGNFTPPTVPDLPQ